MDNQENVESNKDLNTEQNLDLEKEVDKEVKEEPIESENVSKDIDNNEFKFEIRKTDTNKKINIPMYVYIVGGVVLVLIVFIVALAVMAGSDEEVPVDPPKVEENVGDKDVNQFTESDVKKIYNEALPFVDEEVVGTSTYYVDKITVSNADSSYLRAFAFKNIQFKEGDINPVTNEDGTQVCADEGCTFDSMLKQGWYTFNSSLLQEKAKYLYGVEIENGVFSENIGSYTTYNNGIYTHGTGGGSTVLSHHYREFVSYEIDGDTLYVTDKYLYIYGTPDSRGDNYLITIYGDSAKKTKLGSGTYLVADNLVEFIVPTYDRKKVTYKHAFKKAADGHWYWISSEPVK